jgi:hypothetical protein
MKTPNSSLVICSRILRENRDITKNPRCWENENSKFQFGCLQQNFESTEASQNILEAPWGGYVPNFQQKLCCTMSWQDMHEIVVTNYSYIHGTVCTVTEKMICRCYDSENIICDKTRTKRMCSSDFCNSATISILRCFLLCTESCIRTKQLTTLFPFLGLQNGKAYISFMYLRHFTLFPII